MLALFSEDKWTKIKLLREVKLYFNKLFLSATINLHYSTYKSTNFISESA
jgi:hypothetical protein